MCQHTEHCSRATKLLHRANHLRAAAGTAVAVSIADDNHSPAKLLSELPYVSVDGMIDIHARRRSHMGTNTNINMLKLQRPSYGGKTSRRSSMSGQQVAAGNGSTAYAEDVIGPVDGTRSVRYS
jgi:hypothetical protein